MSSTTSTIERRITLAHELRRQWVETHSGRPPEEWLEREIDAVHPLDISGRTGGACQHPDNITRRVRLAAERLGSTVGATEIVHELGLTADDRRRVSVALCKLRQSGRLPARGK